MLSRIIPLAICMALLVSNTTYSSYEQGDHTRKRTRSDVTIEAYEALEADYVLLKQRIKSMELTEDDLTQTIRLNDFIKEGLYVQIAELKKQNRKLLASAEINSAHTDEGATPTKPAKTKLKRRNGVLDLGAYVRAQTGDNLRK